MPDAPCAAAPPEVFGAAAALLAVMAHPARLSVLDLLHRAGPRTVGDLARALDMEQSALSHHLRLLRDAHLVASEAAGRHRLYRLADEHVAHVVRDVLAHAAEDRGTAGEPIATLGR
ncbi:metalloregulator ArsR/SmtB family transcription factor [Myxococcota bacterium]|nr:metalloregulator ArsR/SmtB family transcription factor [Myxococcota bacterium]